MMRFLRSVIIFLLAAGILTVVAIIRTKQKQPPVYLKLAGFTQGTTYNITYKDNGVGDLSKEIDSLLDVFDQSLSTYIPESEISRINRNEITHTEDELFLQVFARAEEVFKKTNGYFDITVAPLVNSYGFGKDEVEAPDPEIIDSLLVLVGMEKITIKDGEIIKTSPGIKLNVNAIAQGFSVDFVASWLEDMDVYDYLVEIGGEIKAKGKNPYNEIWRIGLDKPMDNNNVPGQHLFTKMTLDNMALATSGNYRKFYEKDGVKYTHSIDPKTGLPVNQNLLSATIFAKDCMTADAYATACMVIGLEKAIQLLETLPEISGYLIFSDENGDFDVYASPEVVANIIP